MFKKLIWIIIIFSGFVLTSPVYAQTSTDSNSIKIMTYNIYQSGENPEFLDVIKEENADIMVLVETGEWDDNNDLLLRGYTEELNQYFSNEDQYESYTTQDENFHTSGIAILSRYKVNSILEVTSTKLDNGQTVDPAHDMLVAEINVDGYEFYLAGSHLKCCDGAENEQRRENEQEGFNNFMDNLGTYPLIYAGDLNAFYPGEGTSLDPEPVEMIINTSHPKAPNNHQFIDAFRTLNPEQDGATYIEYGGRIDYIFVNQYFDKYIISSTVGDTVSADLGSDHYSVDVIIDFQEISALNIPALDSDKVDLGFTTHISLSVLVLIVVRMKLRSYDKKE